MIRRCRRAVVIGLMALVTIGVHQLVISICMTQIALQTCMSAYEREIRIVMIEGRRLPCGLAMTHGTILRELIRNVIRIRRTIVISLMALITIRICQIVISVDMTVDAWLRYMRAHKREVGIIMIECRRLPRVLIVTCQTCMRKLIRNMIRACRAVEICLVTLTAACIRYVIVPVDMTIDTGLRRVRAHQRECGIIMIEGRRLPCILIVTRGAIV